MFPFSIISAFWQLVLLLVHFRTRQPFWNGHFEQSCHQNFKAFAIFRLLRHWVTQINSFIAFFYHIWLLTVGFTFSFCPNLYLTAILDRPFWKSDHQNFGTPEFFRLPKHWRTQIKWDLLLHFQCKLILFLFSIISAFWQLVLLLIHFSTR